MNVHRTLTNQQTRDVVFPNVNTWLPGLLMGTSALIGNSAGNAPVLYNPPPGDSDPLLSAVVNFVINNP
jgi:hypothetical protein